MSQLHWSYLSLFKALALGIGATLLSALIPALEAAYTRPVIALQRSDLEILSLIGKTLKGVL